MSVVGSVTNATNRRVMILVPLDESEACKRAVEYYANELMRENDDVKFVFVTSSTGISKKMTNHKGGSTSGLSIGAKQLKEELRVEIHSLYPDLKHILMDGNERFKLPGSNISQDTLITGGLSLTSVINEVNKYMKTKHYELMILAQNQDKEQMGWLQRVMSKRGIGRVERHMMHEFTVPTLVVPSRCTFQSGNENQGDQQFRRKIALVIDDSFSSEYAVKWFARHALFPEYDYIDIVHAIRVPSTDFTGIASIYKTSLDIPVFSRLAQILIDVGINGSQIEKHTVTSHGMRNECMREQIQKYVESHQFDLVVTGSQDLGSTISRALSLNSMSDFVAYKINVPALVIPAPQSK